MRIIQLGAAVAATAALVIGCTDEVQEAEERPPETVSARATAEMVDAQGNQVGVVDLEQTPTGVLITLQMEGLPPGEHGFHIHERGACEGDFTSAGGHYAPLGSEHGYRSALGYHAGDLPNLHVPESGRIAADVFTPRVTLLEGEATLFDADGSAIIVHAQPDDYASQPSGDAGDRLACGVVRLAEAQRP